MNELTLYDEVNSYFFYTKCLIIGLKNNRAFHDRLWLLYNIKQRIIINAVVLSNKHQIGTDTTYFSLFPIVYYRYLKSRVKGPRSKYLFL